MPKNLRCGCGNEIQAGSTESYKWLIKGLIVLCPNCLKSKPGFLDTEEKVRDACNRLEKVTKDDFEKLNEAGRKSLSDARKIILN